MHAHNFLVNQGDQGHVVEAIVECLPERKLIPSFDFVEEAIYSCDGLTFVVPTKDDHLLREAHFKSEQKTNYLTALLPSVHIIT